MVIERDIYFIIGWVYYKLIYLDMYYGSFVLKWWFVVFFGLRWYEDLKNLN